MRLKTHPYHVRFTPPVPYLISIQAHPQEAAFLLERRQPYETWELLSKIRDQIHLRWVQSASADRTGGDEATAQTVWRRPTNSKNIRIPGTGHMVSYHVSVSSGVIYLDAATSCLSKLQIYLVSLVNSRRRCPTRSHGHQANVVASVFVEQYGRHAKL